MKKFFKNGVLFGLTLLATSAFGQITNADNLNWVTPTTQTTATSPNFACCSDSVNYTLSTPTNGNFTHVSASGNGSLTNGVIFPAVTGTNPTQIEINFTFTQDIQNFRIRIHDLDGVGNAETVTGISPTFASLTSTIGTIFDPNGLGDEVNATGDNMSGWINWAGTIPANTTITLLYDRPGSGYGLIIDSLEFQCAGGTTNGCICDALVDDAYFSDTDIDGSQTTGISINSQGELVSSVTIELPFYVSNVDNNCLMCDVSNQESFGTILGGSTIAGTAGVLYDPMGLGFSRKIVYTFPTPVAINEVVDLNLQFPPVLPLSCCKNLVSFCLDVTLMDENCSACEYTICNKQQDAGDGKGDKKNAGSSSNGIFVDGMDMNSVEKIDGLEISPNPASDFINVNIIDESLLGQELLITNSAGAQVSVEKLQESSNRINVSKLPSGVYYLSVNALDNKASFKVVIK
ncbi:MAG: T9SS type A sorting domain-containing protein [Crocinitomicaceae bacterium]